MYCKIKSWCLVPLLFFCIVSTNLPCPAATPPAEIIMQGRLLDPTTGEPLLAGSAPMQFQLWSSATGENSTQLTWLENHAGVPIGPQGRFQAALGESTPLGLSALPTAGAWLGMSVNGTTLSPRQALGSVPWTFQAADSAQLGGHTAGDYVAKPSWPDVDVRDFGATGDGSHDDSTAIQSAIDSLALHSGGCVRFPPGRYRLASTLTIAINNVTLCGAGRGASVLVAANASVNLLNIPGWRADVRCLGFSGGATAVNFSDGAVHKLIDCRIDGAQTGILIASANLADTIHHYVNHVEINAVSGYGILLHHAGEVFLGDISMTNLPDSAYGLVCDTVITALYSERIWIEGGRPVTVRHTLVTPDHAPEWLYFNNVHAVRGVGYGWSLEDGHGMNLVGCSARETRGGPGIQITNAVDGEIVLSGCLIAENDQHGVRLAAANSKAYTRVEHCTIRANSRAGLTGDYAGIMVESAVRRFVLLGNGLWNRPGVDASQQKYGIHIGTSCNEFVIANNQCTPARSDGTGILNESSAATNAVVQDNIQ
jgi:hypothetical protein